jgi:4-hydroxymandelate oxidase
MNGAPAVPLVQALPAGLHTLADHAVHAQRLLDPATWAYFSGGAGDEITLRDNQAAWQALRLAPRVLRGLARSDPGIELLGRRWPHPLIVAPMAYQRLAHTDAEMATAVAAASQGAGFVLSTQASLPLASIAAAIRKDPGRGPLWFQLYFQRERSATLALVQQAQDAGYEALVVTVDAPLQGARDAQRRAGFRLPPGVSAVNLADSPSAGQARQGASPLTELLGSAPTWDDIAWLQQATLLPVILKGVLHPDDALQARRLNVAAVIVSNHGGRTLDTVPATGEALPFIAEALAGQTPLLVDGGIRRGTDVLKALALGARAVLVGRPCIWGLTNAGAVGVAHVLRLLRDEFDMAMALCGIASPADASRALLWPPQRPVR